MKKESWKISSKIPKAKNKKVTIKKFIQLSKPWTLKEFRYKLRYIGIRNPKNIETPPNLTNGLECCFLKFGLSKRENLIPNLLINGTDK